jgi:hypothetical protein
VRALPVAPRPFSDEALGSWIGRLASRYRITVRQLDSSFGLGLDLTGPLTWLLPGSLSELTRSRLCSMTRVQIAQISSLALKATDETPSTASYCCKCVFLNPLEVESPYWKRDWLSPSATECAIHRLRLSALPAWRVRLCQNMAKLIPTVGKVERERRNSAH